MRAIFKHYKEFNEYTYQPPVSQDYNQNWISQASVERSRNA